MTWKAVTQQVTHSQYCELYQQCDDILHVSLQLDVNIYSYNGRFHGTNTQYFSNNNETAMAVII